MAEETDPMLASFDLAEEEPTIEAELSIHPLPQIMETSPFT